MATNSLYSCQAWSPFSFRLDSEKEESKKESGRSINPLVSKTFYNAFLMAYDFIMLACGILINCIMI